MTNLKKMLYGGLLCAAVGFEPAAAHAADLQVQNLTAKPVTLVYASPVTERLFADQDELLVGNQIIAPGETWNLEFRGYGNCFFDLKSVFADNTEAYEYGVNLCQGQTTWTLGS